MRGDRPQQDRECDPAVLPRRAFPPATAGEPEPSAAHRAPLRTGRCFACCISDGTKVTHTEPIGTIPAQGSGHTCTIQLHLDPGAATLDIEVAVRSKSLPGVVRWAVSLVMETKDGMFLDELVDPDPATPPHSRKYRPTHRHQHG